MASAFFQFSVNTYCLVVDSYFNYFNFKCTTPEEVIDYLKYCFADYGIPDFLESDNGPQYNFEAFQNFTQILNIKDQIPSLHYPKSNGLSKLDV